MHTKMARIKVTEQEQVTPQTEQMVFLLQVIIMITGHLG